MKKRLLMLLPCYVTCNFAISQAKTDDFLVQLFEKSENTVFRQVIENKKKYRVQIVYTKIDRDERNKPLVSNYYFNVDENAYFYPASMVKMPISFLSLEKLHKLKIDKYANISIHQDQPWQTGVSVDETAKEGRPSIAHYIKKVFLVSDNDASNRMYQFLGQEEINNSFKSKGYDHSRISRQFLRLTDQQHRITNSLVLYNREDTLLRQGSLMSNFPFNFSKEIMLGSAHYKGGTLVDSALNFTTHNSLSLEDMQKMLQAVMLPNSVKENFRFDLAKEDYQFLYQYMSQYPGETNYPKYDPEQYYDSYVKLYFLDESKKMEPYIRVFNKVGWAYGFLTDVSYIVDFKHKLEYMLSATIYVNENEILNDDTYEYEEIGQPFFRELGRLIYTYERNRKHKYDPDLSNFKIAYETRDVKDTRPLVKNVDN